MDQRLSGEWGVLCGEDGPRKDYYLAPWISMVDSAVVPPAGDNTPQSIRRSRFKTWYVESSPGKLD